MIKAIFIDIDNTLLDFDLGAKDCMRTLLEERGREFREEMFPIFTRVNNKLWQSLEKGDLTKDELFAVRWNKVFEAIGIEGIDGGEFEQGFRRLLYDSARPIDGAAEILEYLHGKYKVYAATNGWHSQQINRLTRGGLIGYIDDVFSSERMEYSKPTKEYFEGCFSVLSGISPKECVMIGDSPSADIIGAINFGMKTIFFPFGGKELPEGVMPDHTVTSLYEIKNIL